MNTTTNSRKWSWIQLNQRRTAPTGMALLLLLTLPAVVQAQFNYTINNGTITITGYTGPGGAVTIPGSILVNGVSLPVTSIGVEAFSYCTSLTNITIPNSASSIGGATFFHCTRLTNVTIGNSLPSIADCAFDSCSSLTSVTIPNSVTSIAGYAFNQCASLTSVTVGNSVTNIGDFAFYYCTGLTGLYFQGNAPSLEDSLLFTGDNNATVYYLPGTTGWGTTFGGLWTALWFLPNPLILNNSPSFGVKTNRFGFIISWATNISVVVEACTNLANHTWSPVGTNTLTGGSSYFSDPHWTNYPARLYRLRSP